MQPTRRQFLAVLTSLGLSALALSAWAGIEDIGDAVNKAGRQRMLSQRMAKAYCQQGLNIQPEISAKLLARSRELFAQQLGELMAYAPTPEIRQSYAQLDKLWRRYDALLAGKPNLANARIIATLNEEVLRVAHQATTQLERHSGRNVDRLINISGRQRMLSQRMAKFYMLRRWGITSAAMEKDADAARDQFMAALHTLETAKENDAEIQAELQLARLLWLFQDQALNQRDITGKQGHALASEVATSSERLLEVMDRVTGLYTHISAGRSQH